jgi:hypothetical protein
VREPSGVTEAARRERTARILGARLDDLRAAPLPREVAFVQIEAAWLATAHAVDLGLLTTDQAETLWEDAAARSSAVRAFLARPLPHAA